MIPVQEPISRPPRTAKTATIISGYCNRNRNRLNINSSKYLKNPEKLHIKNLIIRDLRTNFALVNSNKQGYE